VHLGHGISLFDVKRNLLGFAGAVALIFIGLAKKYLLLSY
jgi:hypothetical protein